MYEEGTFCRTAARANEGIPPLDPDAGLAKWMNTCTRRARILSSLHRHHEEENGMCEHPACPPWRRRRRLVGDSPAIARVQEEGSEQSHSRVISTRRFTPAIRVFGNIVLDSHSRQPAEHHLVVVVVVVAVVCRYKVDTWW
jgi:hypothetical protein